jgi:integrase
MGRRRTFGSVRKLPSGRFQARIEIAGGDRIKAPETFETRKAAELWLSSQNVARAEGTWIDRREGAVTLAEYSESWLAGRLGRPSTLVRDRGYVERYIVGDRLGAMPIGHIQPRQIRAWIADLGARGTRGLAPATIAKAGQILGSILDQAVADRRIPSNPAVLVSWPKAEPLDLVVLTPAQIEELAAAIDPRYRLFVLLGCYAGLRAGELCALRVGDVDTLARTVRITRTLTEVSGHLHEGPPKTKAGRRSVPIPGWLAEEIGLALDGALVDDLVFEAPRGDGPMRLASWRTRYWRDATKAAGIPDFRIHDMRHTAVSLWIAAGYDARQIATWAGHSSVVSVFDRYGHLIPGQDTADLMDRLDALRAASLASAPAGKLVPLRQ